MKHTNRIAIRLTDVSKEYTIHHEKPTLVEKFVKGINEQFLALDTISLTIHKGEKAGIIGPNGSGKTTLLKVIAGIATPTHGTVEVYGKIVSLIDLEAGFHPDLSGEQNIFLNGMLLGMSKRDIAKRLDAIIRFADIGQFIDAPLFTYSEGMKLRVGFAIAVHANPDILILDEGLSVGDREFQKKSQAKIQEFFRKGKTVLVVTHWLGFVRSSCNRVLVMGKGRVVADGPISLVDHYEKGLLHSKRA